jgi:transposase-like protein
MERKNRIYPEEFKLEALEMLKTSGKVLAKLNEN